MKIEFYGRLGDCLGREVELNVPDAGCTVGEVRAMIAELHPDAAGDLALPSVRACLGDNIVGDSHAVTPRDTLSFFPPLSGG